MFGAVKDYSAAIMQPYFLPYVGYWQLMNTVDVFVIYDDIQYTKKGWINKNRFLLNKNPENFSLPVKRDSDYLDIRDRELSDSFDVDRLKLLRRIEGAYRKAPFFDEGYEIFREILDYPHKNLFSFIFNSIKLVKNRLSIETRLVVSSTLGVPRSLKGQDRVIATCKKLGVNKYINPIGGIELYSKRDFKNVSIELVFQRFKICSYDQFENDFVPNLSIVDVIMFLGVERAKVIVSDIDLIDPPI